MIGNLPRPTRRQAIVEASVLPVIFGVLALVLAVSRRWKR